MTWVPAFATRFFLIAIITLTAAYYTATASLAAPPNESAAECIAYGNRRASKVTRAPKLPDICPEFAPDPFLTLASRQKFQDYVNRLSVQSNKDINIPSEFWDAAPLMHYWGYRFIPNEVGTYDIIFEQKFDARQIFLSIEGVLNGLKADGCSYFHAENATTSSVDQKQIVFTANVHGKMRACGDWPWGGEWKTDIGDISGRIVGSFGFRTEILPEEIPGTMRYNGQVIANRPTVSLQDINLDIFGINSNSVAGQMLTAVADLSKNVLYISTPNSQLPLWSIYNRFSSDLYRIDRNQLTDAGFLNSDDGQVTSSRYRQFLADIRSLTWSVQPSFVIDDSRTGLISENGTWLFNVAFVSRLKSWEYESALADIVAEIELIKSFRKDPVTVTVKRGDSFWRLAFKQYRNPFFYQMLLSANGKSHKESKKMLLGSVVLIPPAYALAPTSNVHFASPGESIYSICNRYHPNRYQTCSQALYLKNPQLKRKILFAGEAIILPQW